MTPQQKELAASAIADLRTIDIAPSGFGAGKDFSELMREGGIMNGFVDFAGNTATGFSADGLAALAALAKLYRPDGSRRSQQASNATLAQFVAAAIAQAWKGRHGEIAEERDYEALEAVIETWFSGFTQTRLHAVPCIFAPYAVPPFAIGPVTFHHLCDFPAERFGVEPAQIYPVPTPEDPTPEAGGFHFGQLFKMAAERRATWVAVVEISGRAEDASIATADVAVDIALGVLQIAAPGLRIRNIARATGRSHAIWRADVHASGNGIRSGTSNLAPALTISPKLFAHVISNEVGSQLAIMGRRLTHYLAATSVVPCLDEAWCNAVYWFHEALAETLDTVAVVKLETAIEVLFRAESMSGSKSRIEESFNAIYGLAGTDVFPGRTITVEQYVLNITTARSRVVHGTWPTIHTDLPGYKKQTPVTRPEVEMVTSSLLIEVAHHIEAYVQAGETADDADALLSWVKKSREEAITPGPMPSEQKPAMR